ncbi:MAG: hypothetical protein RLZZ293_723 [Pseudomonadota bacterium]|jgi:phosphate acetyltransferase
MSCNLVVVPTEPGVGGSNVRLGVLHALEQHGYSVGTFHPFRDTNISNLQLQNYILENRQQDLIEDIMKAFEPSNKYDFVIIEGVYTKLGQNSELAWFTNYVDWFNDALVRALMGYVILVTRPTCNDVHKLEEKINIALNNFKPEYVVGFVISKLNAPINKQGEIKFSLLDDRDDSYLTITHEQIANFAIFQQGNIKLLGTTPWNSLLSEPRIKDVMQELDIQPLIDNTDTDRRIKRVSICSRYPDNLIRELVPGTLIVTSADRADIILTACLAEAKGIKLAGILLTADYEVPQETLWFCYAPGTENKLPIYANQDHRKTTSLAISLQEGEYSVVPVDDLERINLIKQYSAEFMDIKLLESKLNNTVNKKMSPPAFRYMLIKLAQQSKKRIVLPEGDELRTLTAAIHCQEKGIADCILLGDLEKIHRLASTNLLTIPDDMKIINPKDIAQNYIEQLVELRKNKGMNYQQAYELLLHDCNYLGTMMIYNQEVDGMVSGAENTTAATVRPALQIVKTRPDSSLVSSVFFMCLEDQVLVYGDCAINTDPNAEELADIAIQSADTAVKFNIEPRVAMISYSTGDSGTGADVEKVKLATELVKQKRPDIIIDGPLQYDAAMNKDVAIKKAPNSLVAGKATVCIFPDLNTGNTTYKAVQRSANVLSIGPVLQGLNKPVNDLSRGATVDDIIYTIAITAIQS